MKQFVIIFLCFWTLTSIGQTQCTMMDIFPVMHGINKFKAITTIASKKNIKEDKEANRSNVFTEWDKPNYLKGDSVLKSSLYYDYVSHPCFEGDDNKLYLTFVDDYLYKIAITLNFSSDAFEKCIKNYNGLVAILKPNSPYVTPFVTTDDRTEEQIGEGYWLRPNSDEKRDKVKIEKISIGYEIDYEWKYDSFKNEYYKTGNINKYVIEIEYVNLKGTKLTNEEY